MEIVKITSSRRMELIDITSKIQSIVQKSAVKSGICVLFCPHTTAGLTINENADPSVKTDINNTLNKLIPQSWGYSHIEGNSDAHVKSTLVGPHLVLIIEDGNIVLGTWQGILFAEFGGPRTRRIFVKIIEEK